MADCDLCGVARPTLCPVKVIVPRFQAVYPNGTWKGLNRECLEACHQANQNRQPATGKKCHLCGRKDTLYRVTVPVTNFEEPYQRTEEHKLCHHCLEACETAWNQLQEEHKKEEEH